MGKGNFEKRELWRKVLRAERITVAKQIWCKINLNCAIASTYAAVWHSDIRTTI